MTLLVTGGMGFIGSNYVGFLLKSRKDINIVNLDKLTYAADVSNVEEFKSEKSYTFVKGDICDKDLLQNLFKDYRFNGIVHFAAESHVDNSINNPENFIYSNIVGTFNLLEIARQHWMNEPFAWKPDCDSNRFHHISTDEVYGSLGETGLFTEETPYAPNSPYSASKASSDFLVRSYYHTYGMNVVTTNCSNNYGPKQHDEKLIPTIIRKALSGEDIPIYGDGLNVRDWLYVDDHCRGIELAFRKGRSGQTYNIGGKNEHTNLEIAETICRILDEIKPKASSYNEQITFVKDRPGHDFRYAIDATKIESELGWEAEENFESGMRKTVYWFVNKYTQGS
ncbi:MAG: dTDP-glucose 4,6-dehydratase [Bacteroidia bacterium]|nr:dTDP-glucose 4,6-dehydratase [Bacteroidia bacterium]